MLSERSPLIEWKSCEDMPLEPLPSDIDGVIDAIDEIIELSVKSDDYLGIFAFIYLRTTEEIKRRVEMGEFDHNPRMQELDVVFANLYIKAYDDYHNGLPVSQAWKLSLDHANDRLTLIQHLLLGMNAHINLDLAIAASIVMEGKDMHDLADDFRQVNTILADITNELQSRLGRVSPLLFLLDWIGQRSDEKIADFSITAAREFSWQTAISLWESNPDTRQQKINEVDQVVARLGKRFATPRARTLKWVLSVIGRFESTDKAKVLDVMRN